ncbi:MAG: hypothetical protein COA88_13035 [Kordia sp.]|nr:MAG: hypothetical protein COA88_13035 [Kordia sp.]
MKKLFLLVVLLHTIFAFSQVQTVTDLPTITPPSPTAFQMTQYGDLAVNESTGNISPSIPLYTYQAGRLQLPISLNYQGNGVKVDQAASWTGINWNLNAGGVITRVVRDLDDLDPVNNRIIYIYSELNSPDAPTSEDLVDLVILNNVDSEVDMFNFSFPGYSGSFYLTLDALGNYKAHLSKDDTLLRIYIKPNITITNDGAPVREISILTPEGIMYHFGGINASETSKTINIGGGLNAGNFTKPAQTAFYLYKIIHPLGDEIELEYSYKESNILIAVSEIYTKLATILECLMPDDGLTPLPAGQNKISKLRSDVKGKRFLSKISSNKSDYQVQFTAVEPTANEIIINHYSKILTAIQIVNNTDPSDVIKSWDLTYLFPKDAPEVSNTNSPINSERFFLEKVGFNDGTFYAMEYNSPDELPNRFSYDQDHMGYFNNKGNIRYIPKVDHPAYANIYSTLADKSSVFKYSSKGVLNKLIYPTGGYSKFEYESGYHPHLFVTEQKSKNFIVWHNDYTRSPDDNNPASTKIGTLELVCPDDFLDNCSEVQEIIETQLIDVRLSNILSTTLLDYHTSFRLKVSDIQTGNIVYDESYSINAQEVFIEDDNVYPYYTTIYKYPDYIFEGVKVWEGKQYKFEVEITPLEYYDGYSPTISVNVDFNYDIKTDIHAELLGIRIKAIDNFDSVDTTFPTSKSFSYNDFDPDEVQSYSPPRYLYETEARICCSTTQAYLTYVNLTSSSINTLYANGSNQNMYKKVKITTTGFLDNKNGHIEKEFMRVDNALPLNYFNINDSYNLPNVRENKSVINGTLTKESVFADKDGERILIKETNYDYSIDSFSDNTPNNATSILYNACFNAYSSTDHLYLGLYNLYSTKLVLNSTTVKDYMYSSAVASPEVVETKTSYTYQYVGLPSKVITETSEQDIVYETKNMYPSLGASLDITQPISVKTLIHQDAAGEEQLSFMEKTYLNFTNFPNYNLGVPLLSQVNTSKGSDNLEARITYHDYDNMGNPIELSKADGVHIVYIWGYNQTKPIAKIINTTYQEVEPYVTNLQTLSNADTDRTLDNLGTEGALREALDDLRTVLSNAQVITFTYDPLIGTTSTTDPRGYTSYYHYDEFHRLQYVKDAEGNILSENEYNYRTQN